MLKFACSDFPATVGVSSLRPYGIVRNVYVRTFEFCDDNLACVEHQPTYELVQKWMVTWESFQQNCWCFFVTRGAFVEGWAVGESSFLEFLQTDRPQNWLCWFREDNLEILSLRICRRWELCYTASHLRYSAFVCNNRNHSNISAESTGVSCHVDWEGLEGDFVGARWAVGSPLSWTSCILSSIRMFVMI